MCPEAADDIVTVNALARAVRNHGDSTLPSLVPILRHFSLADWTRIAPKTMGLTQCVRAGVVTLSTLRIITWRADTTTTFDEMSCLLQLVETYVRPLTTQALALIRIGQDHHQVRVTYDITIDEARQALRAYSEDVDVDAISYRTTLASLTRIHAFL